MSALLPVPQPVMGSALLCLAGGKTLELTYSWLLCESHQGTPCRDEQSLIWQRRQIIHCSHLYPRMNFARETSSPNWEAGKIDAFFTSSGWA